MELQKNRIDAQKASGPTLLVAIATVPALYSFEITKGNWPLTSKLAEYFDSKTHVF